MQVVTAVEFPELDRSVVTSTGFELIEVLEPSRPPDSWVHHWMAGSDVVISLANVEGRYVLRFQDGAWFAIDVEARTIAHRSPLNATSRHQLLDQVLPRALEGLGYLMVHSSGIDTPSGAVIFIGDSGAGKSTLSASFRSGGTDVLSDDCMRLTIDCDGDVSCVPTYTSLRLWPDSANALLADERTEPMSAGSSKRRVQLPPAQPSGPSQVRAICVLAEPDNCSPAVRISPLAPARAVSLLLAQCFRLDPTDAEAAKRTFERCADLVERVPVVELSYPREYDRLPEVREAVLQRAASGDWTTVTAT